MNLLLRGWQLFNHGAHSVVLLLFSQTYLCSSCGESESCLGWVGGHLSSPTEADCPSEQDVRPSEKEGGPWKKASCDGPDRMTKPKRCPCGCNTSYKTQRRKEGFMVLLRPIFFFFLSHLQPVPALFKARLCPI